jgi:hypothetical protein
MRKKAYADKFAANSDRPVMDNSPTADRRAGARRKRRYFIIASGMCSLLVLTLAVEKLMPQLQAEIDIWRLYSANPQVRTDAAKRLGRLKVARAVPRLVKLVIDGDNPIGGGDPGGAYLTDKEILGAIVQMGPEVIAQLRALAANEEDPYFIVGALVAIVNFRDNTPDARSALIKGMANKDLRVRRFARWGLQEIQGNN